MPWLKCPDCDRIFFTYYGYAKHRAYKHDDRSLYDKYYENRGREPPHEK